MSVRFVVLTTARSGSTHLQALLNRHPAIRCHGELFLSEDASELRDAIGFWESPHEGKEAVGAKLMYYHDRTHRVVWDHIASRPEIRIIHLVRANGLERYVSNRLVKLLERRHLKKPSGDDLKAYREREASTRFAIDREDLTRFFRRTDDERDNALTFAEGHPTMVADYAELCTNSGCHTVMTRAVAFLGLPDGPQEWRPKTVKMSTLPLPRRIENFDELREHFRSTKWASFFR